MNFIMTKQFMVNTEKVTAFKKFKEDKIGMFLDKDWTWVTFDNESQRDEVWENIQAGLKK